MQGALLATHVHPEGVDGAFIQALAVSRLCKLANTEGFSPLAFIEELRSQARTPILRDKLGIVCRIVMEGTSDEDALLELVEPSMFGRVFQIRASEAVASALLAFARDCQRPDECLIRAVNWGGDADTVGCILGALLGAMHGTSWLPPRWLLRLEASPQTLLREKQMPQEQGPLALLLAPDPEAPPRDAPASERDKRFLVARARELARLDLREYDAVQNAFEPHRALARPQQTCTTT
jgi:hypothetical protein